MIHKPLLWLTVFLLQGPVFGQNDRPMQFQTLGSPEGLSSKDVTCITQDQKGFIWIGTLEGLNYYDGHEIKPLKLAVDGKPGLPSNRIQSMVLDSLGYLWIGLRDAGLCRYDPKTQSFFLPQFINAQGEDVSNSSVFRVVLGRNNELFAATSSNGLLHIDLESLETKVLPVNKADSAQGPINIQDIIVGDGFLWLGTFGQGVIKYIPGKGVVEQYTGENREDSHHFKQIRRMVEGIYPDMWIAASDNFLHRFNRETLVSEAIELPLDDLYNYSRVYDLLPEGPDSLWLANVVGGLQLLHTNDYKVESVSNAEWPGGLGSNSVWSLFRSREGILWVGTRGNGLAFHHPATQLFEVYSKNYPGRVGLDIEDVQCIYCDEKYLFAGGNFGINRIDLVHSAKDHYLEKRPFYSVLEDPSNSDILIFGSDGGRLVFFNKEKGIDDQLALWDPEFVRDAGNFRIRIIAEYKDNLLLLGTDVGLAVFDLKSRKISRFYQASEDPGSIQEGAIINILKDHRGRIWLGSTTGGLSLFNPDTDLFIQYGQDKESPYHLPSSTILDILEDANNRLWLGTEKGLIHFDPDQGVVRIVTDSLGLPSNYVVSISEDQLGNLWLTSLIGLSKYHLESGKVEVFKESNGLPSERFSISVSFVGPDQKIYLGTNDGLIGFYPEETRNSLPGPDPKFVNLLIYNLVPDLESKLPYRDDIIIKPHQKFFTVEVSAFDFLFDKDAIFRYRVKELDNEWYELGKNRIISFTELKPSSYTLEVEVANKNSDWIPSKKPLKIEVRPALTQMPLFRAVFILLVLAVIAEIFRQRTRYLENQRKKLNELVEQRTKELSQSERNLLEANQAKDKFFSILAHDLRSPFSSLLGLSKILEEEWSEQTEAQKKKYVASITRNLENTFGLVNNLLDWSRLQQGRFNPELKTLSLKDEVDSVIRELNAASLLKDIRIISHIDQQVQVLADAFMLATVVRNLLSNAIKYSSRGQRVQVDSKLDGDRVICCVIDSGKGISSEKKENLFNLIKTKSDPGTEGETGTGLGLIVTREFMTLMNGEFFFESREGQGSRFCFSLKKK